MSCPAESAMLIFMHAFQRRGELDRTRAHTRILRDAIAEGARDLMALVGDEPAAKLALVLHVRDYTYALSLGRPLALRTLTLDERIPTRFPCSRPRLYQRPRRGMG